MGNSGIFDVWEAVQIAIEEEHHGLRFYEALTACAQDPALRKAAKRFADEERDHEGACSDMLGTLGLHSEEEAYPGEYIDYVNALIACKTFENEGMAVRLAEEACGDLEAVATAILFEKNTLLFLGELRALVPPKARAVLNEMIEEDRQHLIYLTGLRTVLTG